MRSTRLVSEGLRTVIVAAVVCIGPTDVALAQGWYSGIAVGASKLDVPTRREFDGLLFGELDSGETVASTLDEVGFGWNASFGYRWGAHLAAELGYTGLGKAEYKGTVAGSSSTSKVEYRSRGAVFSVLGFVPVRRSLELFGRAGIYAGETRMERRDQDAASGAVTNAINAKANSENLLLGAGISWSVAQNYALRLEYQRFFDVGDDATLGKADVDLFSVGLLFR